MKDHCQVCDSMNKIILVGSRNTGGLYLVTNIIPPIEWASLAKAPVILKTWHHHLGHISYVSIIELATKHMVTGMPTDLSSIPPVCEHCILGKQTKNPVPKQWVGERSTDLLDTVFSDITGPEDVPTGGKLYALNFIDDNSSHHWCILLAKKSDAHTAYMN